MTLTLVNKERTCFFVGIIVLLLLSCINLLNGETHTSISQLIESFKQQDSIHQDLLLSFRAPRVVAGILAGSALAACGALMQSLLKNPLVSPGIVGISAGSYLMLVTATIFFPLALQQAPLLFTLLGGCCAIVLVYLLSGGKKSTPLRVVLSGLIVSMTLGSITTALILLYPNESRYLVSWSAGSLRQNDWSGVQFTFPWIISGLLLITMFSHHFEVASLGSSTATSLGLPRQWIMAGAMFIVLLMTGATVTLVGPIGFIGLLAPHLVKLIGIYRYRALFILSAIWGAVLLLAADCLTYAFGSLVHTPPVGAITAAIGSPCLLWLILRHNKTSMHTMHTPMSLSGKITHTYPVWLVLCISFLLMMGIVLLNNLSIGSYKISLNDFLMTLLHQGSVLQEKIIWDIRLPRSLNALLAGASLAAAGTLFQALLRNPLADSAIIGVSGGATATTLLIVTLFPHISYLFIPLAALIGGITAGVLVYILSWFKGLSPTILILTGVSVSAVCSAIIQIIITQSNFTSDMTIWLVGGLYGTGWSTFFIVGIALVILAPLGWLACRALETLSMGDLVAKGLGVHLEKTRIAAGFIAIMLAAISVSQTGPIAYVGLIAPHCARLFVGHHLRHIFIFSLFIGAIILSLADILARTLLYPTELPAGALIAFIGAPYIIYLIYRNKNV